MGNTILILTLLIILSCILGGIVAFAGNRRMKCKRLVVKDLRNPNLPEKKYYARFDKRADMIYLYANLFYPFKDSMQPPFNMEAYLMNGVCYCVMGVTGNPDDKNIVPIRRSIIGKTGAKEFSRELGGAISNTEAFITDCLPFRIGQEVEYVGEYKRKNITSMKGLITQIGCEGIVIEYDIPYNDKQKDGTVIATTKKEKFVIDHPSQIKNLKSITPSEEVKKFAVTPLSNFFSDQWVMANLGVIPVEDVNAVLESEKSAVAQYNSSIEGRMNSRLSWASRHGPELLIITFFAVTVIMSIIYWNAVNSNIMANIAAAHGQAVQQNTNTLLSGILPKPVAGG